MPFRDSPSTTLQISSQPQKAPRCFANLAYLLLYVFQHPISSSWKAFPADPSWNHTLKTTSQKPCPCLRRHCIPRTYHRNWQRRQIQCAARKWIFISFSKIGFVVKPFLNPFSTGPQSAVLKFLCGTFHVQWWSTSLPLSPSLCIPSSPPPMVVSSCCPLTLFIHIPYMYLTLSQVLANNNNTTQYLDSAENFTKHFHIHHLIASL